MQFINIADLKDWNDPAGRSFREVNNAKKHKYKVGDLVTIPGLTTVTVTKLTRDCDGSPLYSVEIHGYTENSLQEYTE